MSTRMVYDPVWNLRYRGATYAPVTFEQSRRVIPSGVRGVPPYTSPWVARVRWETEDEVGARMSLTVEGEVMDSSDTAMTIKLVDGTLAELWCEAQDTPSDS